MDSMFKRTGSADFPDRLKALLSGPPKSGKTSFLGTVPNIIIADTEPGSNNLQSIAHLNLPYITVYSTEDLKRLLVVLGDDSLRAQAAKDLGMPAIEAVAIDTTDTLQNIMKAERLRDMRQTQFLREDWGWLREEMTSIIRAFTALPLNVFFTVHTKNQEQGKGDDARTIVLPGLQGSISEEIAGMVGYSLYCFRKQEIAPDGSPYVKYWMRTEGDETFTFLGNRAAGELPTIIEPKFSTIYETAMKGRAKAQAAADLSQLAQSVAMPQAPAAPAGQDVPAAAGPRPADDFPIDANGMAHLKGIFDAVGLPFPEQRVRAMTMAQGRDVALTWRAAQEDQMKHGRDAKEEMIAFLDAHQLVIDPPLDINATADVIMEYVGSDPTRIQAAIAAESAKPRPRTTLIGKLEAAYVKAEGKPSPTVAQQEPTVSVVPPPAAPAAPEPEPAAPDANTPQPPAEALSEVEVNAAKQAVQNLGADGPPPAEVIVVQPEPPTVNPVESLANPAPAVSALAIIGAQELPTECDSCHGPIVDQGIANLSRARFGMTLCVNDYIAQTNTQ